MQCLMIILCVLVLTLSGPYYCSYAQNSRSEQAEPYIQSAKLEFIARLDQTAEKIAVSPTGQIFLLTKADKTGNMEIFSLKKDGTLRLFPDEAWYKKQPKEGDAPYEFNQQFFSPRAVRATLRNSILVLDAGDKTHTPRVIDFDLNSNSALRSFYIPREYLTEDSYLIDMAYDWEKTHCYILDLSTNSAIIVYNLKDGTLIRRPIDWKGANNTSIMGDVQNSAIVIDVLRDNLYFFIGKQPKNDTVDLEANLWRLELSEVSDVTLAKLESKDIIRMGSHIISGGIIPDSKGNIYTVLSNKKEIGTISSNGIYEPYIKDDRIGEIVSLSFAPDGYIYAVMSSQSDVLQGSLGKDNKIGYFVVRFKSKWPGTVGG